MDIPLYQVDAFTGKLFSGNPAAVCPLDRWLPDEQLQAIAAENNLSETAFFVKRERDYHLRWMTPTTEVDLCGHATLAAAFVLWDRLGCDEQELRFHTRSGELSVRRRDDLLVMSFPVLAPAPVTAPREVEVGLGQRPIETLYAGESDRSGNYLAIFDSESEIRAIRPDFGALGRIENAGVIVSAHGKTADFVSRFFAVPFGINEDPVTGSIHSTLTPYWAKRLGKNRLHAMQVSERGGELFCELGPDRVEIAGRAVLYLEGIIHV
jgi:PhzF family phenazine biosynthesis protein